VPFQLTGTQFLPIVEHCLFSETSLIWPSPAFWHA